ncbi:uncharacterized protein LOC113305869 [Papaver somniferum]|uniref:uncharacterized protein LOC113305869 n=1 Tax=Papaver somniferum TaxID=3469 RepID=UPI000E6FE0C6|nr:uncharacterized protein LOC113305869 [Papaver somniferum]
MDTSQRIKLFIWKCLQDALPTEQKLKSVDNKCVFCKTAVESTFHLFFDCDYAKAVWNLHPMAVQGLPHSSAFLDTYFLHKYNECLAGDLNSISMALAATKCWFIWKERCLRIFEDKSRTPIQLAVDILRHYEYWHPMTLNSFDFVLRNWTGTFKGTESGISRSSTAEEEEALVLLQAAKWDKLHNIQHLVIEGDNMATIRYLQENESTVQWQSIAILDEVKKLVKQMVSFLGFQYVDRRANKVADQLAKKGRKGNTAISWLSQAPLFLIPKIAFHTVKAYESCNISTNLVSVQEEANLTYSVISRTTLSLAIDFVYCH